ncbi:MAG: hypothetical protein NW205_02030 [Hyphomicrobiaceae bacterium]|nr:hypothetical protein [Hyphomicrobiaceae bacterium]
MPPASPTAHVLPRFADPFAMAHKGDPLLAMIGLVMALMMIPTVAALLLDGRTLGGVNVWVKPLKFEASLAVHLITVALALTLLPEAERGSGLVKVLVAAIVAVSLFEIAYIAMQAARGQGSHYNTASAFTRLMFAAMGIGAMVLVAATAAIGLIVLRHASLAEPLTLAVGLGLALGGLLGGVTGLQLGGNGSYLVGTPVPGADTLPIVGWSRTAGDLRVAHFIGLHLMQALPLLAIIARVALPASAQVPVVIAGAALGVAATFAALAQARAGLPLWPLG